MTIVERLEVAAYEIPTDSPESDGTLEWTSTTIVVVRAYADGVESVGYTYSHPAAALLIDRTLRPVVEGTDALAVSDAWRRMVATVRNVGRPGLVSCAVSAVDAALWDLKARLLQLPLVSLLGQVRAATPVYGSGGFTSYSLDMLEDQLARWAKDGIRAVKMKVGRDPERDIERVQGAREAIGDDVCLFVDANGAYRPKQALEMAAAFGDAAVTWFEEPVSSDDLEGLRFVRDHAPAGMDVAAGEYGYDTFYFRTMLDAGAVDVLQADATRCGGITGFMSAAELARVHHVPLSAHTAPALHVHPSSAALPVVHLEYFHDHVRIEEMVFEGAVEPHDGALHADPTRMGLGLEFKVDAAAPFEVYPRTHAA